MPNWDALKSDSYYDSPYDDPSLYIQEIEDNGDDAWVDKQLIKEKADD